MAGNLVVSMEVEANNKDTMVIKVRPMIHINRAAISNNKIRINNHTDNSNISNLTDSSLHHLNNSTIRMDRASNSNTQDMVSRPDNKVIDLTIQQERETYHRM